MMEGRLRGGALAGSVIFADCSKKGRAGLQICGIVSGTYLFQSLVP